MSVGLSGAQYALTISRRKRVSSTAYYVVARAQWRVEGAGLGCDGNLGLPTCKPKEIRISIGSVRVRNEGEALRRGG